MRAVAMPRFFNIKRPVKTQEPRLHSLSQSAASVATLAMSDSEGPNSKSIPSWQRQEPSNSPNQPDNNTPPQDPTEQTSPEPRASLIEKASKFLEDDSIRDAPIERKKLYLESKGLSEPEINDLLEIQQTPEAAVMEDYGIERQETSKPTAPTAPQTPSTASITQQQETPLPTATPSKDTPPIITYPEFLLHTQKPAPLITAPRLLTSLYIASGAVATIYGTSKYIIEPMVSNMTTARHSLFENAGANIAALNEKLEGAVSKVPDIPPWSKKDDSDTESITSSSDDDDDGARFFNRSAGTQTSPRLSRSNLSSPPSSSADPDEALSPVRDHTSALLGMQKKLSDLLPADKGSTTPLGESIDELRAYLETLPYTKSIRLGGKAGKQRELDAVANVKADIRGVKGVLLSARNFPSGVTAR